jgi:hypothetical protein
VTKSQCDFQFIQRLTCKVHVYSMCHTCWKGVGLIIEDASERDQVAFLLDHGSATRAPNIFLIVHIHDVMMMMVSCIFK